MTGVILAAGGGTRLGPAHSGPKCLLELGGSTLLERHLRCLERHGIDARIVVGYQSDAVRAHLRDLRLAVSVEVIDNESYREGNIISCQLGLRGVDGAVVVMDADVLFAAAVFDRLVASPDANAMVLDTSVGFGDEEYMAGITEGRVTQLRRGTTTCETEGEWVGFVALGATGAARLSEEVDTQIAAGHRSATYEQALTAVLGEVRVTAVDVADLAWIEIDFPEDLEAARGMIERGEA